jgi:hypothetical protein
MRMLRWQGAVAATSKGRRRKNAASRNCLSPE